MLEAFERHLTSIDIGRKFEKAKTNDDKIALCKEFLEKHGYKVKKEEPAPKKEIDDWYQPPQIGRFGAGGGGSSGKAVLHTYVTNNTSSPAIQAKGAKVLQSQYMMSDDMIRNYPYDVIPEHVKDKLLSQMLPEIIDHAVFVMETEPYDISLRAKLKLGVFKP